MTTIMLATMVGCEKTVNSIDTLCSVVFNFGDWLTGGYNEELTLIGCVCSTTVFTAIPTVSYGYFTQWKSQNTLTACKIFPSQYENVAENCIISQHEQLFFIATLICLPYAAHSGCAAVRKIAYRFCNWLYRCVTWQ